MANKKLNNLKLGLFVITGLLFMIVMLYMIGKDQNLFSRNIELKARFNNAQGLVKGNNVKYAGIQVGTVSKVKLINDSTVEVTMLIEEKYKTNIGSNAVVSIGTEGFIGNKIVSITPGSGHTESVEDGNMLASKKIISTDDMLETLSASNRNIAFITDQLKTTVQQINNSKALWQLLDDKGIPANLRNAAVNINAATAKANNTVNDFHDMLADIKEGKGSLGKVLTDTSIALQLSDALEKLKIVGDRATQLSDEINSVVGGIKEDVNNGKGTVNALLKDSSIVLKLNNSLYNIEEGTAEFNQVMDAIKQSFLFKGYFRRLEKQKAKKENVQKSY
jgi:phospholipid/cholesterol/gamma-HCH transport system substrate-binding protein